MLQARAHQDGSFKGNLTHLLSQKVVERMGLGSSLRSLWAHFESTLASKGDFGPLWDCFVIGLERLLGLFAFHFRHAGGNFRSRLVEDCVKADILKNTDQPMKTERFSCFPCQDCTKDSHC